MGTKSYNENSIEILEGLEAVRKRPGMYIGSTDSRGLHHLIWEIVDNAIDEAMAGYGKRIVVILHKDGSCSVEDNGRGIPTGRHKTGKYTPEVVYTELHAGGKFNSSSYAASVGLHGVGASVVTALSEYVELYSFYDGNKYHQIFRDGAKSIEEPEITKTSLGKTGCKVNFKPSGKIFSTTNFSFQLVSQRLQENAFLLPGVEMVLIDERNDKTVSFKYDDGLTEYVKYINEEKETLSPIMKFSGVSDEIGVEVVMQYVSSYDETLISFANNVKTIDGGTHVTGFRSAFTRCLNEYGKSHDLIKDKDKVSGDDYKEGLVVIISVKIPEKYLQFEGQTKSKLGSPEVKNAVDSVVGDRLSYYLIENKEVADAIILKAKKACIAREAARKAREEARSGKKAKSDRLVSDKLVPCQSKKSIDNELFLVEGDSAGGSAKQGRDNKFQAILPLRGKVINSEKSDISELLKNEEISTMIYTIGAGFGNDFHIEDSNYGKVIIMTDADTDGAHIQVLLLAFFFRYMRPMVEAGRIYVACPPLYKVFKGTGKTEQSIYCWDEIELEEAKKKIGSGYTMQRYKGLGEMNPSQLWETTMDPKTRSLVQVTIEDLAMAERNMTILMGKDSKIRREWIEDNVAFTLEDDFLKEDK